jgi:hypothetical protein
MGSSSTANGDSLPLAAATDTLNLDNDRPGQQRAFQSHDHWTLKKVHHDQFLLFLRLLIRETARCGLHQNTIEIRLVVEAGGGGKGRPDNAVQLYLAQLAQARVDKETDLCLEDDYE